jgi:hypothetical protein
MGPLRPALHIKSLEDPLKQKTLQKKRRNPFLLLPDLPDGLIVGPDCHSHPLGLQLPSNRFQILRIFRAHMNQTCPGSLIGDRVVLNIMLHDSMPIVSDLPSQVIHPHFLTHIRNLQSNNMIIRNFI